MARLVRIDPATCNTLAADDRCWYIGEYTSGGGFRASATNQSIFNLKKKPPVPQNQIAYKNRAIQEWGRTLAGYLNLNVAEHTVTFVPAPSSKPEGHAEYDDRMWRVLQELLRINPRLDIRQVLYTPIARRAQHEGDRLSIEELCQSMRIQTALLDPPLRSKVFVVDDVFTIGRTFKAMQQLLSALPNVAEVVGLFLARTVWPNPP